MTRRGDDASPDSGNFVLVVAAVIARDGCVLACQRNRSGKFPLKWEFPGGKVHEGESPQAALARELREELTVEASVGVELHRTTHKYPEIPSAIELIFFAATIASGEIDNRVFETIAWIAPRQLPEMDFLDADREFISKLATGGIPSWSVTDANRDSSS
ncbi:MAG TPA: (deoxy)nucleoside triphosphate pyrophosphohydrolase [Candidatus Acidoferrales bacterium]|nr:(deoxy)nucleoside triphosphate pyrophosphohydrolase [Candidatus Acidoferrales bacterium]